MIVDAIPAELRELDRWVLWRKVLRDGKPKKEPYTVARPDRRASSTHSSTWASLVEATGALHPLRDDGIGYAIEPGLTLVDLDDVINGDGTLHPAAAAIVADLDTYTEWSQSGSGLHLLLRGRLTSHRSQTKQTPWQGELAVWDHDRFVYLTGNRVSGTPAAIEERQEAIEKLLAHYLPTPAATPPRVSTVVEVDDRDLLDRAMSDRNFRRLYDGDWSGYPSQSEADLAFCRIAARWTRRDPARIDVWLRSSGLMRDKWERADYRQRTIETAISGTSDVYRSGASQVRPGVDALTESHPVDDGVGAGCVPASLLKRDAGRDAPTPGTGQDVTERLLYVVEAVAFAGIDEASAEPLLGDRDGTVLAAGGALAFYGDGGAGKTTLGLDQAFHLCAGIDWLGLRVPRPVVVLWIENEGPRGKFREKLRAKFETWDDDASPLDGRLHVLEQPWSRFTFAEAQHRAELVEAVRELKVDVVIAGPVARLGIEGGGTPAQVQAFVDLLELVRAELDRPLAFELILHENKAGEVSGAWEGATDTLVHVQPRGNGHTAIVWRKVRWHSLLHGKAWKLDWLDGERFDVDDTPDTTDEAIADQLLALVRDAPGGPWSAYDALLKVKARSKRRVRDELIADGQLVNAGAAKAMKLYLPGQEGAPEQGTLDDDGGGE
jgi:hypothetical protein